MCSGAADQAGLPFALLPVPVPVPVPVPMTSTVDELVVLRMRCHVRLRWGTTAIDLRLGTDKPGRLVQRPFGGLPFLLAGDPGWA
ncbi:MAG: hypothetical protein QM733_22180 [Ilumatobacteraceae bacterium]